LLGRNPSKIKDLTNEIQAKYRTQVKSIVVDLSGNLIEDMSRVDEAINDLNVGILINNVGVCYPYVKFFHKDDSQLIKNLIAVNVENTTRIIQTVLLGILKRKKGAIVNIGSSATPISSSPLYIVHVANKTYADYFSKSLYMKYKQSGFDVQYQNYGR
jgi:17beta-estradiol 17-dehydrogenase / very-long-chain 3-oxoacyl-CoA reductase